MEERLPEDEERCEDAPESIYQFVSTPYELDVEAEDALFCGGPLKLLSYLLKHR